MIQPEDRRRHFIVAKVLSLHGWFYYSKTLLKVKLIKTYFSTNLVSALSGLDVYDFPHCE